MPDTHPARTHQEAYLSLRNQAFQNWNIGQTILENHIESISTLLFTTLPHLIQPYLNDEQVYFFNEHYVVKPSNSLVEFQWHRVSLTVRNKLFFIFDDRTMKNSWLCARKD